MLQIFLAKNFTYLRSKGLEPNKHTHVTPQLSLVSPPHEVTSGRLQAGGLYFPSEVPHAIVSDGLMHSFMLNPVYGPARSLARCLPEATTFEVESSEARALDGLRFEADEQERISGILDRLLGRLVGDKLDQEPLDKRIAEAVAMMDDLEEKRVAAGDLAEALALSESRFLHLFKDELRMTVRKYLLWRRTIDGARAVIEGLSITEAAHSTGFTDSAHFAKSFKQMFGLTLSGAFGGDPRPKLVVGQDF